MEVFLQILFSMTKWIGVFSLVGLVGGVCLADEVGQQKIGQTAKDSEAENSPEIDQTNAADEEAKIKAAEEAEEAAERAREAAEKAELNKLELEDPFTPRYILEAIEVRGNDKSRGDLIIAQILLKPGDVLDEEKVDLSRIRLLALGYFKDVRMRLEKGSERGRVKLVITVEERNTIIIDDLFFGWSDTNPFWGGLGISDINFLGRGLDLSFAFVASEHQQAFRLGLFWPSVFNSRFQAGIQALVSLGEERALSSKIAECQDASCDPICAGLPASDQNMPYLRAGGVINFGIRLDRIHRLALEFHAEHIDADVGLGEWCDNHPFNGYIRPGQSTFSSMTFRFTRDTRDDYFLPTQGMHLVVSIELASKIFGSDYEFSKYMLKYEHSFPAFLDHAVRLTLVGGLIQDVGERGSPFFSRFYVGDYAFFLINKDSLPRNLELNFSEVVDYGDLLASVTAEYDIPLWSTGKFFYRGYVYAAVNFSFVTKAAFLASSDEWSGRTKRPVSFDIGFKVDTPVGLFTFSLGYVMDLVF